MSLAQLKVSLRLWTARYHYRRGKRIRYYRHSHTYGDLRSAQLTAKWRKLEQAALREMSLRRKQIAAKTPKPSVRGKSIAWAASKIGITENPSGSNGNPVNISVWQHAFGFGRVPWCGVFVGTALNAAGVKGVTSRIASVGAIEDDAKAGRGPFSGWTTDPSRAMRGDAVVLFGYGVHTELVEKVLSNGALQTIGGNTSGGPGGSQANGGGVFRRIRSRGDIRGVAHVDYPN